MPSDARLETLVDSLVQTSFRITSVLTRIGAEHDMSLTQMRMLGILVDRRVRVTDLAAHMGLDKSTLSGLIDRAERRGLVRREKNPDDGRAVDVMIDAAGLELARAAYREVHEAIAPATGRLDRRQIESLTRLLGIMLEAPPPAPARR
ncbi:MarR family transcriptional regulator [Actinoplanes sp. NPDC051851]|uniref:MarR family winged helix-turn-helix transcriptional regulator n=1 Tax=Actinoplanes sp. NPDC051851 TaxID=3154753 RepID=UPI00341C05F5